LFSIIMLILFLDMGINKKNKASFKLQKIFRPGVGSLVVRF